MYERLIQSTISILYDKLISGTEKDSNNDSDDDRMICSYKGLSVRAETDASTTISAEKKGREE